MKNWVRLACLLLGMMLLSSTACAAHKCSFGSWRIKRSATCTRTGLKFKYCVSCDHWEQREIPRLPHEVAQWTITKEPTCLRPGGKEGVCSSCGNLIKYSIDKLEHTYGEMIVVKEPTCTRNGKGEYTCSGCGRKREQDIAKLGHNWETTSVSKAPTCTSTGKGKQICSRCQTERDAKLEKLEHAFGEWTITQEPDGMTKGVKESVCQDCGKVETMRFYHEGTLYQDMPANEEVIRLQQMLTDLGYYSGPIKSGTYGKQTGNAVARFQREYDLEATEVADPITRARIVNAWELKTGEIAVETLEPNVEVLNTQEMLDAEEALPVLEG